MGRGLSELQKCILRLAREEGEVTNAMILHAHYGWKPKRKFANVSTEEQLRRFGQIFSTTTKNYRAACVVVSRARTRLCQRGLTEDGVTTTLTEAGKQVADSTG